MTLIGTAMLSISGLKKYYPIKRGVMQRTQGVVRAVDDVSLEVQQGETVSIVGESGCGKTTLARLMVRLIQSDCGKIVLDGVDISHLSSAAMRPHRRKIQMVFQDPYSSLDPFYTVRNLLKEALTFEQGLTVHEKDRRMADLLKEVQLPENTLDRFAHEFSGGERQRIAIARALLMKPNLLILDEAVSSLDVLVQDQILKLLLDLKKKFSLTYIFISHNLRVVKKISDKIAVMHEGKIVEFASAGEIFTNPAHSYTRELIAAAMDYKTIFSREEKI